MQSPPTLALIPMHTCMPPGLPLGVSLMGNAVIVPAYVVLYHHDEAAKGHVWSMFEFGPR